MAETQAPMRRAGGELRARRAERNPRRAGRARWWWLGAAGLVLAACGVLAAQALWLRSDLLRAAELAPRLESELAERRIPEAQGTLGELRERASGARAAASGPLWDLAAGLPWIGPNLRAGTAAAQAADTLASKALPLLLEVASTVDPGAVLPGREPKDLAPLAQAVPKVEAAAEAVRSAEGLLGAVDTSAIVPQLAGPVRSAHDDVARLRGLLDTGEAAARMAPGLLGADGPRTYLVLVQNNAEARASGGIPGALVEVTLDRGAMTLGKQGSASGLGSFLPRIPVDPVQQRIYSTRLGRYMQDVNLTPDFPTAGATAAAMWEREGGKHVDGVVSLDPVALARLLGALGPVELEGREFAPFRAAGLPATLTAENATRTLLSDVYRIEEPKLQDVYFAAVAREIFASFSAADGDPVALARAVTAVVEDGRLFFYSSRPEEQATVAGWDVGGAIDRPGADEARFGAYFNDGTGAKMDYYVRRTVELVTECTPEGTRAVMRITVENTAPADAATALPRYVTGNGAFGIPPGSVQTNVIAYGPKRAAVEGLRIDGRQSGLHADVHAGRPLATSVVRLSPGQKASLEFVFSRIPEAPLMLDVTPGVQPKAQVVRPFSGQGCRASGGK
ncbi:DUF4012 domain-containing protein [Sinomonas mesophila]|uniref:DUF4012 domain-containing protein n=1 Tax=Sinomonas mesophila TaxID=1531955 RepID=UPI00111595FE|nr:DUF4012 domain-containing protein [Sinomonas mesophila]